MTILDYIDYRHGKLWITEEFLTETLPFAPWSISVNTIRNGTRKFRKHQSPLWENHPHIKLGRKVLINFDSIEWTAIAPFNRGKIEAPLKQTLINLLQNEKEAARQEENAALLDTLDVQWMHYFNKLDERYFQTKYKVNREKDDVRANHLAQSVAILRLLVSGNLCGFSSKKDLQTAVATRVKELELYGKGLSSYDRLRKTEGQFKKALADTGQDERDVVVSGLVGNTNRQKFDDVHRTVALRYYLGMIHQQKPDKFAAWRDYQNHMIMEHGCSKEDCIKQSRFKQITLEKKVVDMAAKIRHGSSYYEAFVRPFVLRCEMEHSLTLVAGDGWEPGHSVSYSWRNPKTGRIETRTGTMSVWIWYDWKAKAILSHFVAPFENGYQIRMSFRDIIGLHGACPRSLMIDKKWAEQHDTASTFEKANVFIQPKKAYSPWTSIAERNNKEANKIHRYLDEHWVNMTQNHSLQSQHNEEKVRGSKALKEEDFREMVYHIIERYNHTPLKSLGGKTPMEVFEASKDPQAKTFDPLEMTWIFGETKITTVRNYNAKITIASREYTFAIPPEDMRSYWQADPTHGRVRVYYDERHMDSVDLYAMVDEEDMSGDSFICTAINKDKVTVSPSTLENQNDPAYADKMEFQQRRIATLDKMIEEETDYMDAIDETMGWDTAAYMNTSQEQYKEMHSNAVARQYRDYHQDREEWEGHKVKREKKEAPVEVMTEDEKYARLRNQLNK